MLKKEPKVTEKRILIEQLQPGMYLMGMDKSWWQTPFFFHRRLIRRPQEITLLKQLGVREVTIDPARGNDVAPPPPDDSRQEAALPEGAPPPLPDDPRELDREALAAYLRNPASFPHKRDLLRFAQHHRVPVNDRTPSEEIVRLCLQRIHDIPKGEAALRALTAELPTARAVREASLANVQAIFEGVKTGARIDSPVVWKTVRDLLDSILRCHSASLLLLQMRQFDADLFTHAVDVCVVSLVIGKEQGLDQPQLAVLGTGALLHDVGQMRLPHNLVHKPGLYTDRERRLMQAHAQLGAALLSQVEDIAVGSRRIVAEHHERADGSGYPAGLTGAHLSALSQVVGIVDIYDTMLGSRGGRPPLPPTQALKQLYQLGVAGQLDQEWVERIIRSLTVYPVGALIELDTGEWGVVIATSTADTLRPAIKLIRDGAHRSYAEPRVLDLSDAPGRVILRVVDPAREGIRLTNSLEERD